MRTAAVLAWCLFAVAPASGLEESALKRLGITTDRLVAMGEEMVGETVSGTMGPGDTVGVTVTLDTAYSYHMYIWTNSLFNLVEFWVKDPTGEMAEMAEGDHATLSIYPGEAGDYHLLMTLHQADEADSAGYAAALFHRPRISSPASEED